MWTGSLEPSNNIPPSVAPNVIASCIMATIKPPPNSASLGKVRVSQVFQATGAEVPINPQTAINKATIQI